MSLSIWMINNVYGSIWNIVYIYISDALITTICITYLYERFFIIQERLAQIYKIWESKEFHKTNNRLIDYTFLQK